MVRRLVGILQPMKTEDSAGAQNIWGFGKEFETGVHPTGSDPLYKRTGRMHFLQHGGLSSSNPPLEVPSNSLKSSKLVILIEFGRPLDRSFYSPYLV